MNVKLSDHLPPHIRKRLEQASEAAQAETAQADTEEQQAEQVPEQAEQAAEHHEPEHHEPERHEAAQAETEQQDGLKEANDLAAMKGRLKKVQEERDRLAAAAQNGAFATAKLMEMQERVKAQEAELAALREAGQQQAAQPETLSDEDKAELVAELGESLGGKIAALLARPAADGGEVAALRQEMQQREQQAQTQRWFAAVKEQIPEFQGLVQTNAEFLDFLHGKKDWAGNSAFDAVGHIGRSMDIDKIPTIRALIDEFKQGKRQAEKRVASAPPAGGGGLPPQEKRKRQMTAADRARADRLKRVPGGREAYLAFMEQFE